MLVVVLHPGVSSSITSICNITLSSGVWAINYRIAFTATANSSTTSEFVMALFTANKGLDTNTRISYNVASP